MFWCTSFFLFCGLLCYVGVVRERVGRSKGSDENERGVKRHSGCAAFRPILKIKPSGICVSLCRPALAGGLVGGCGGYQTGMAGQNREHGDPRQRFKQNKLGCLFPFHKSAFHLRPPPSGVQPFLTLIPHAHSQRQERRERRTGRYASVCLDDPWFDARVATKASSGTAACC